MKTEPGVKIHNSRVQESGGFYCRTGETGSRGATPATGPHARNAGVRAHGEERTEGGGRRRKEGRMAGKRRGGRKEGRKGERTGAAPRTPPRHEALRGRRPERGLEWSPADSCASEIIRPSLARSPKAPAWACPEPWPAWTTVIGLVPGLVTPRRVLLPPPPPRPRLLVVVLLLLLLWLHWAPSWIPDPYDSEPQFIARVRR